MVRLCGGAEQRAAKTGGWGGGREGDLDLPGLRGIFGLPIRKDLIFKATEQTERRAAPLRCL